MKRTAASISLVLLLAACNTITTGNTGVKTLLTKSEISSLDKEYSFGSMALTQGYLKRKLERWLDISNGGTNANGIALIKEIEYARYRGETAVPFKTLIDNEITLLTAINNITEVIAERSVNAPFRTFLDGMASFGLPGNIYTVAGIAEPGSPLGANLRTPYGLAVDNSGNVLISDTSNDTIKKIDKVTGKISIIAGAAIAGGFGDGGPATAARFKNPFDMDVDSSGNIYIADAGTQRIRKIDAATGIITTVAGNGSPGYSGDGGSATAASINNPWSIDVDNAGNIFIADRSNQRIRKVDAITGIITTVAGTGNGNGAYSGDGGQATAARLNVPWGVAVDSSGNIFISDYSNNRIRRVDAVTGIITTIAGNGTDTYSGDGGQATAAGIDNPHGIITDNSGNVFFVDRGNNKIRKIDATGIITTVAGTSGGYSGDGGQATAAQIANPAGLASDSTDNLVISELGNARIRKVDITTGIITSVASSYGYNGDNLTSTVAQLAKPQGVFIDSSGNMFIADTNNHRIRKVSPAGIITTVAGDGTAGYIGDGEQATAARLRTPNDVFVDNSGNIFIADTSNNRVRKISATTGIISTVAGNGSQGYLADNVQATATRINHPKGVAVDNSGNIFISDSNNHRIRKVDAATGVITTVSGNGTGGYLGDGGQATAARLSSPFGIKLDNSGNLFIADYNNNRIRKVNTITGIITSVATNASLDNPYDMAIDTFGNIFISDTRNNRIIKADISENITIIAGNYTYGYSGDNGPSSSARFYFPSGITLDSSGNIYVADSENSRIRKIVVD